MLLSRLLVFSCGMLSAPALAHAAGGAYAVDDAIIGAINECQVESWAAFGNKGHDTLVSQPACVISLGVPVEVTVLASGLRVDGAWSAVGGLQGKLILVPLERNSVGLGISFGRQYDVSLGEGVISYVNVPATLRLNDQFRFHLNGGWLLDEATDQNHVTWGGAFEWDAMPKVSLIGEIYGQLGPANDHDPRGQFGIRYSPYSHVDCDFILGDNIAGEHAQWLTTGVTVRF